MAALRRIGTKARPIGIALISTALFGRVGLAQAAAPVTVAGLGTVTFPVSSAVPRAINAFGRGVLLLHLFEYPAAANAFRRAERLDPSMVMAYWGEAMSDNQPVWNEQNPAGGRAALAKLGPSPAARAARAPTARERGYLAAVDLLYGAGPKARRDTLYSAAMGRLSHDYPADDEARLFYALSLLGLNQGVRDIATYLHAAAIADSVFVRHPDNPGASHYLIHALDDPEHAALGLAAARALARLSPAADHAQHMASHIFMALGRWGDVVRANRRAMRVVNAILVRAHQGKLYCRHYNVWLDYGLVEQGRLKDAAGLLRQCRAQVLEAQRAGNLQDVDLYSLTTMWSQYVLSSGACAGHVAHWQIEVGRSLGPRLEYWFTKALCAARRRDLHAARLARDGLASARQGIAAWIDSAQVPDPDMTELRRANAMEAEVDGLIAANAGNTEVESADLCRATAAEDSMAYAFGPPLVGQPTHELLGHALVRMRRFAEAETQFRISLQHTPMRTTALLGAARSAAALGDTAAAVRNYRRLTTIWRRADPRVRGLAEARNFVRRHGGTSHGRTPSTGQRPRIARWCTSRGVL